MVCSLVVLFIGLGIGSVGADLLNRFAPGVLGTPVVAYVLSIAASTVAVFVFLVSAYRYLTNVSLTFATVLPGALFATVALEASFQVLPVFLRLSNQLPALQAFGGPALLLVWLYVLGNIIVLGAEINFWRARR
jgi:membrane protein